MSNDVRASTIAPEGHSGVPQTRVRRSSSVESAHVKCSPFDVIVTVRRSTSVLAVEGAINNMGNPNNNPNAKTQVAQRNQQHAPNIKGAERKLTQGRVGASRRQVCVICSDLSQSMLEEDKCVHANAGRIEFVTALAAPSNRDAFDVVHIGFGSRAQVLTARKRASAYKPAELSVAAGSLGELTNMADALAIAETELQSAAREPGSWIRPVVIVFTDGHSNGADPLVPAAQLKQHADVVAAAFGASAHLDLLRKLATSPAHAVECRNGADLRRFFAAVGATISVAAATGQQAAALLGDALLKV